MSDWMDGWLGLAWIYLRTLLPLEHLAVLINIMIMTMWGRTRQRVLERADLQFAEVAFCSVCNVPRRSFPKTRGFSRIRNQTMILITTMVNHDDGDDYDYEEEEEADSDDDFDGHGQGHDDIDDVEDRGDDQD